MQAWLEYAKGVTVNTSATGTNSAAQRVPSRPTAPEGASCIAEHTERGQESGKVVKLTIDTDTDTRPVDVPFRILGISHYCTPVGPWALRLTFLLVQ